MVSVFFSKSKPINYILTTLFFVGVFVWHFIRQVPEQELYALELITYIERTLFLLILLCILFIGHFIVKNNKLDNNNSYSFLINVLLLIIFSDLFYAHKLVLSNFFLIIALWNLIASDSFSVSKARIFNASLCVLIASLFEFWAILFMIVVYLTILMNLQNEFRRFLIPIIAAIAVFVPYFAFAFYYEDDMLLFALEQKMTYHIDWFYMESPVDMFLNGFFVILTSLTFMGLLFSMADSSKKTNESYLKLIATIIITVLVGALMPLKTNDIFIFALFPVTVMATRFVEILHKTWARNLFLSLMILISIISLSSFYWEEYLSWEIDYELMEGISKYFVTN